MMACRRRLTGTKSPEQAMKDSQAEAERILSRYR